ncbi:hypothetical protein V6N13_006119 [Hibiscus sabdariffa]|uniref:Uncharacterized protein n=1 Tax=Hibiscus sabdariffa TaxID=183260 RepID=A0ABR2EQF0_9ROSI
MQEALTFQSRSHFLPSSAKVDSFTGYDMASMQEPVVWSKSEPSHIVFNSLGRCCCNAFNAFFSSPVSVCKRHNSLAHWFTLDDCMLSTSTQWSA